MKKICKGKFTLVNTDIIDYMNNCYDDYTDWCRDVAEREPLGPDSFDYEEWCANMRDIDWEIFIRNIRGCKQYDIPVVVVGELGLWNGHPSIIPKRFNSVHNAVDAIISGTSYYDVDINFIDGMICVKGHHHDGTNTFEIHALSRKGIRKFDSADYRFEDVHELKPYELKLLPYLYAV